jgi:iron complex outermembrane receptor protein
MTALFAAKTSLAQQTEGSGQVVDVKSGEPVVGVNILVQETISGTTTDLEGRFTLSLSEKAETLTFRFVGYKEKEKTIDKSSDEVELTVALEETEVGLDEVVVSASKHEEKVLDAPASISVLNADEIEEKPVTSPVNHLEEVEGVDIMKTGIISSNVNVVLQNNAYLHHTLSFFLLII